MNNLTIRRMAPALMTLAGLVASANAYGVTVDISTILSNPGFELGLQPAAPGNLGIGCPAGWLCAGSPYTGASAYLVTTAQYVGGPASGLTGTAITPGGLYVATLPTPIEGSGSLKQIGLGTYAANTTYSLTIWIGTPLTVPFCGIPNADPAHCVANVTLADSIKAAGNGGVLRFYFLGNGANQLKAIDLPVPARGLWTSTTVSYTPSTDNTLGIGQSIGILIFESSGLNNELVNIDIVPACTCP
jgi:hypothetical protein